MSDISDLKKRLSRLGFKLERSGKHLVYRMGEVRLYINKGSKISPRHFAEAMKTLKHLEAHHG